MMGKNPEFDIVHNQNFSFDEYKKKVDEYRVKDKRETRFQNDVAKVFLKKLFVNSEDISIVEVSGQHSGKDSKLHNPYTYISPNEKAASPDLLIAHNWNYANKDNEEGEVLVSIELKSPELDPINIKDISKYEKRLKDNLEVVPKVILTDCIRWQFFESENELEPVLTIDLFDKNKQWKTKIEESSPFFREMNPDEPPTRESEPDEWEKLCDYIREFAIVDKVIK